MDSTAISSKTFSLREVMLSIQSVLHKSYGNKIFWVRCELSRITLAQSGHCYLELIDKNETTIVAQQRGIIWADQYTAISEKFKAVTNSGLSAGMKILLHCSVTLHPLHGLSLTITDIDPSFTLGEMARMKNESIARLKMEGLYNRNKSLTLPLLPSRIAIISIDTSRGYLDFISTIESHQRHYAIVHTLFDAILQGENAPPTIISAINKINSLKIKFDAIVIIRGGAGDAGLACYDEYLLAATVAQSELPVITGIGHASNETVVEMISFQNCITPTAAATFILEKFDRQFLILNQLSSTLMDLLKSYFTYEKQQISSQSERFSLIVNNQLSRRGFQLKNLFASLPANISKYFSSSRSNLSHSIQAVLNIKRYGKHLGSLIELNRKTDEMKMHYKNFLNQHQTLITDHIAKLGDSILKINRNKELLQHLEEKVALLDPVNTLVRGYSITRVNGKAVTDASEIKPGIRLETELANGTVISTAENK